MQCRHIKLHLQANVNVQYKFWTIYECKPTRKIAQNPPQINKTTTLIEVYIIISAVIAAKMSNRQYMQ